MVPSYMRFISRYRQPVLITVVSLIAVGVLLILRGLGTKDSEGHAIPSQVSNPGVTGEGSRRMRPYPAWQSA